MRGAQGKCFDLVGVRRRHPQVSVRVSVSLTSLLSHHLFCVLFHSNFGANNLTKKAEEALQDARWSLVGHEWRRSTTHLTGSRSDTDEESGRDDDFWARSSARLRAVKSCLYACVYCYWPSLPLAGR